MLTPLQVEQVRGILLNYIHMLTANEVPYNTATIDQMIIEARMLLNAVSK